MKSDRNESNIRTGIGFDAHRLESGVALFIGGVEIPYEKGLQGHSDGDVLIHAIIDSLLGAANLGDIGKYFPSIRFCRIRSRHHISKSLNCFYDPSRRYFTHSGNHMADHSAVPTRYDYRACGWCCNCPCTGIDTNSGNYSRFFLVYLKVLTQIVGSGLLSGMGSGCTQDYG